MNGYVNFPKFSNIRCLMMPFIQGEPDSLPDKYYPYRDIVSSLYHEKGAIGFLTIDESFVAKGSLHRGARAKTARALHTEAGRDPDKIYCWGAGGGWGKTPHRVTLDREVEILLASNLDNSCAVWPSEHENTSSDGDIGYDSGIPRLTWNYNSKGIY